MAAESVGQIGLDLTVNDRSFKKQMVGIQGMAKKAGAALAAAFAVKKIIDFGASCIELGSDLAEVQNVVDVTFPRMSKQVDEFARNAAGSFGRLKRWQRSSRVRSALWRRHSGSTSKQPTRCLRPLPVWLETLPSFYNISQDEAYTKMRRCSPGKLRS